MTAARNYRDVLIKLFTFLGGIYFFLEFVLPEEIFGVQFGAYHQEISTGFIAVGALTFGLGLINILMVHGTEIVFQRPRWPFSLALLLGLFGMTVVTSYDWYLASRVSSAAEDLTNLVEFSSAIIQGIEKPSDAVPPLKVRLEALQNAATIRLNDAYHDPALQEVIQRNDVASKTADEAYRTALDAVMGISDVSERAEVSPITAQLQQVSAALSKFIEQYRAAHTAVYEHSLGKRLYTLLFDGLFVPLGSSMFSLLGFYIATAAYRAFRIRSLESALMMAAATIVMLGQIPFGVWIWGDLPAFRLWLLEIPNAAAFRAITFGAAIAGLIMAFRMWLSIESRSFVAKGTEE